MPSGLVHVALQQAHDFNAAGEYALPQRKRGRRRPLRHVRVVADFSVRTNDMEHDNIVHGRALECCCYRHWVAWFFKAKPPLPSISIDQESSCYVSFCARTPTLLLTVGGDCCNKQGGESEVHSGALLSVTKKN